MSELSRKLEHIWLFDEARKRQILKLALTRFEAAFGAMPTSVTAYPFPSSALRILQEITPGVEAIVGGCFEEGGRVFHGCNHSWYLFNEGMPWGPWYPSQTRSMRPARNEEDAAGVMAVPHLVRDTEGSYGAA